MCQVSINLSCLDKPFIFQIADTFQQIFIMLLMNKKTLLNLLIVNSNMSIEKVKLNEFSTNLSRRSLLLY